MESKFAMDETSVDDLLSRVAKNVNSDNDLEFLKTCSQIGKYKVKQVLGAGGQAICFLAMDTDLRRKVVIKLYQKGLSAERRQQILQEGQALAKIDSPHVAQCHSVDTYDGRPFLVLEFINGKTLDRWVESQSEISVDQSVDIVTQLSNALTSTHKNGLLHLDVKPRNVIMGNDGKVFLIDFGLSRPAFEEQPEVIAGTPSFVAPDIFTTSGVDMRSDIYGLGAILFFLLTRHAPVEGDSKSHVLDKLRQGDINLQLLDDQSVPEAVKEVCRKCLNVDPDERFQSGQELIRTLKVHATAERKLISKWHVVTLACTCVIAALLALQWLSPVTDLANDKKLQASDVALGQVESLPLRNDSVVADLGNANMLQVVDFVLGRAKSLPLRNDFEVTGSFGGSPLNFGQFIPRNESRNIRLGDELKLELQSKVDCHFYVYSIDYSQGARLQFSVIEGDERDANSSDDNSRFDRTLEMSITPDNEIEYLWILASKEKQDPYVIAEVLNEHLENLIAGKSDGNDVDSPSGIAGVDRGIRGKSKEQFSELLIPYVVVERNTDDAAIQIDSGAKGQGFRTLMAERNLKEAEQLIADRLERIDQRLESEPGADSDDGKLKCYLLGKMAQFSEARGDFNEAIDRWRITKDFALKKSLDDSLAAESFASECENVLSMPKPAQEALARAYQNLLIGQISNSRETIEQAYQAFKTKLGPDNLLTRIAFTQHERHYGRRDSVFAKDSPEFEYETLVPYFEERLGNSAVYTVDVRRLLTVRKLGERRIGLEAGLSLMNAYEDRYALIEEFDPHRVCEVNSVQAFLLAKMGDNLDQSKNFLEKLSLRISKLNPPSPSLELNYRLRLARYEFNISFDHRAFYDELMVAHSVLEQHGEALCENETFAIEEVYTGLVMSCLELKRWDEIIGFLEKAAKVTNDNVPEGQRAGSRMTQLETATIAYISMGDIGNAKRSLSEAKALVDAGESSSINLTLLNAYVKCAEGKFESAIKLLQPHGKESADALIPAPKPKVLSTLSYANLKLRKFGEAAEYIDRVHGMAVSNVPKKMSRAKLFEAVNRLEAVGQFRNQAVAIALAEGTEQSRLNALRIVLASKGLTYSFLQGGESQASTLDQLKQLLPDDTCLVEFVKHSPCPNDLVDQYGPLGYAAFVIQKNAGELVVDLVDLGDKAKIDDKVLARWNVINRNAAKAKAKRMLAQRRIPRGVKDPKSPDSKTVDDFDTAVWSKIRIGSNVKRVVICPDGRLAEFPWSSIKVESRFLCEDYELATDESASIVLARLADAPKSSNGCLAIGGVDFGNGTTFETLENSLAEAKSTVQYFDSRKMPTQLLTGSSATKKSVLEHFKNFQNIYIATHGVKASKVFGKSESYYRRHVLTEWALALANANEKLGGKHDPGRFLDASEIRELDLDHVDLVVLSSCHSASGRPTGNSVYGIEKAFRLAGSNSTLTCQYTLDDLMARKFVESFNKHRALQKSKSESFRQAQFEMIAQSAPSHTWNCWVLTGDWR